MINLYKKNSRKKLHILMINAPHFWASNTVGGQEILLLLLTERLIQKGNRITVVLPKEVSLCEYLRRVKAKVEIIPLRSKFSFAYIPKLIHLIKKDRIHLVHTHECRGNLFGFITAKIARIKMIVTRHEIYLPSWLQGKRRLEKRTYMLIDKILFNWVDKIIAVSEKVREEIISSQGVNPDKVTTVHVGVDLKRFVKKKNDIRLQKRLKIEKEYLLVGSVGRLVPEKGYEYLLKAVEIIKPTIRKVKFIIVGDGPEMGKLKILSEKIGLSDKILFLGRRTDVPAWINLMDIFVLPSLTEGLPVVLLEAMAMRKPVVATNVGGIPEVITHMQNGVLVSPCNSQQLAEVLIDLLGNKSIRESLAREAQKTVEHKFNLEMMVEKTYNLYQEVLRG